MDHPDSAPDRPDQPDTPPPARDVVRDRRPRPHGALPRRLQTWLMLGLAAVMLLIILVTGRTATPRRTAAPAAQQSTSLNPERLRQYQEQLAEKETRLRQELADTQAAAAAATHAAPPPDPQPPDPMVEEQRRRAYASLFADNVAFTRRAGASPQKRDAEIPPALPGISDMAEMYRQALGASPARAAAAPVPTPPNAEPQAPPAAGAGPAGVPPAAPAPGNQISNEKLSEQRPLAPGHKRLIEGTVIEAVLTNRLDGSFAGPVNALVTVPVYSLDRQVIVIPAGARVLGAAAPVQAVGESRLAVKFHRLVMPDGRTFTLDQFTGLNERGDAGLSDRVNRHYLQLFGASMAIGALSGLAQYSTRSGTAGAYSFSDAYGQGVGGSLAASSARILDRFLNVLPSITIREGHRLKIYLTSDLDLPPYEGVRP